ncbi:T9SS type A sorting domain-containing protein [Chryseobacterium sediminis]|uniref:T9SS type A sorting domain-containing protein n=1 Tax=Chryseobacterium sediminis TaxID=1679494 RepID=A0A5B2U8E1_9FLAO|nr:T9SS type A sorting domain-containing protein [Chryseobacterium sediminis]KAA2222809.1 T9SS type A sorting domain-containing protein [Chryseobacterium sediminis]
MKKITTLSGIVLCSLMNAQLQYCMPTFQYGADSNMISNVTFGSINHSSPVQSGNAQIYENFTSMSTDLQPGSNYNISVTGPSSTFPSDVVLFIDFNQNGNFDDAGESFYIGRLEAANPANAFTINNTITIPATAVNGSTRMRVLKNTNVQAYSNPAAPNSISSACDSGLRAGQTEDYTVNIVGNTVNFPAPYCGAENVTSLTVSEISKVEFAGTVKNSAIDGNSDVLENFIATVFTVNRGNTYPITVTGGTHGQNTVSAYAYIDFNHNNQFDADEKFNLGYLDNSNPVSGEQSGVTTGNITIPAGAQLGETRFRLVKAYESNSWMGTLENLPCPSGWFIGQAEDYTLKILPESLSTIEVSKEKSANVQLYPNPTTNSVNIRMKEGLEKYEIYNISGQKLLEGNSLTISMDSFVPGTYLIKIQTKNQKLITEKIIKK